MKVLIDCVPLAVGGGVQVAIGVLVGLQKQVDIQWAAVVPNSMRRALPDALAEDRRITYVNRRSQADRVWLMPYLHAFERRMRPDVVFTVFGPPFFRARAPHLVGFALPRLIYDPDPDLPQDMLGRISDRARVFLFQRADFLVVETETARARVSERMGIARDRIFVIANGPNPLLTPLPDRDPAPDSPFIVLTPSAYYRHKNLEIIPRVAAAFKKLSPDKGFVFRLTLAADAPEWLQILEDAKALGVQDHVETLGVVKISDLAAAYRDASAVYLPTLREVSTAVYPESFFFRRPLVTTDMDFARDLCGEGAILVDPRAPEDAAARLAELAASPDRVAACVEAGSRQLAKTYPTAEAKFEMQMDLLRHVAAGGGPWAARLSA